MVHRSSIFDLHPSFVMMEVALSRHFRLNFLRAIILVAKYSSRHLDISAATTSHSL